MKKITIELNEDDYNNIKDLINWINLDNQLRDSNKVGKYSIEDYVKGSVISKIEEIKIISPLIGTEINTNLKLMNNFKSIAKKKKVRQVDICRKLGIHKSNLSLIFNNKDQPRTEVFFKIWVLLECPPLHECIYFQD